MSLFRKSAALFLGGGLLVLLSVPAVKADTVTTAVDATAALGTVVTATVTLANWGQPATTVLLYGSPLPPAAAAVHAAAPKPLRVPLPGTPGPVTAELLKQFAAAPDGQADMLVYMADQADLSAAASIPDWNARGAAVVDTLTAQAARTQQALLNALRAKGHPVRSFWIVNALIVHGDRALAQWLSTQASVGLVGANTVHALDQPAVAATSAAGIAWGVAKINAPGVWADWNDHGEGIVVATIDTGVDYTHGALLTSYRGWSPSGVTNDYNWYDATTVNNQPCVPSDPVGHGTHTMGTIVGQSTTTTPAIGVAPKARWIAARGCASTFCTDAALLASAQWMLAPTDCHLANARPDLRPHIISNSWGALGSDQWYAGYVAAWNAAGIFSVFAGGNYGFLGCQSTNAPGNYASALAVGATDPGDFIADFSSRGPTSDGRIKPDISAPGVDVPSAWPGGLIVTLSGTSMATPHVAGAAALLWSANPLLIGDIAATRRVLTSTVLSRTSTECGDAPGATPNNVYGWGRLDAHAAVLQARLDVPWLSLPANVTLPANGTGSVTASLDARQVSAPGQYQAWILAVRNNAIFPIPVMFTVVPPQPGAAQLTGQLVDRWTSSGVYGRLQLDNQSAARTDANGFYTVTLPLGTHPLTATATGYMPVYFAPTIVTDTKQVLVLTPDQPHLLLSAPTISATLPGGASQDYPLLLNNAGPQLLSVTVSVPPYEWSVAETTPQPGPAPLYDLSPFPPILLGDDQVYTYPLSLGFSVHIYGALVNQIYLSSNGWVSAAQPSAAVQNAECLPNSSLPAGALAPFWTDLDPSITGTVRAGAVTSDTFVVGFENVPHWSETPAPTDPKYTFQLALHADGKVNFIYGPMGMLPAIWSAGVSQDQTRGQNIACYRTTQSLAGRRWTAASQPLPAEWLSGSPEAVTISPGVTATVVATLHGFGYVPWRADPFASVLRLTTNDPLEPVVDVPAEDRVTSPPPYGEWLPLVER